MTPGQYLREIINTAKDMLDEEGQHHYNLIVDEEELESCYDKLDTMRNAMQDEKRGING